MLLQVPQRTPYDLNFRLLRFPVRVHPLFWLTTLILGWNAGQEGNNTHRFLWVLCAFVSILVHELGHGLVARVYGARPEIVLHAMGGLCVYSEAERQTPLRRLAVLIAGPGAGFVLFGLILLAGHALAGLTVHDDLALMGLNWSDPGSEFTALSKLGKNLNQIMIVWFLIQINLYWGLLNLLPIWPLDGGQMATTIFSTINRREGLRWALILSIATGAVFAAYSYLQGEKYRALFFGLLAANCLMTLQMLKQARYAGYDDSDDADWWKR